MSDQTKFTLTQATWAELLTALPHPPFLQSWGMKPMHEQLGDVVIPLVIRDDVRQSGH